MAKTAKRITLKMNEIEARELFAGMLQAKIQCNSEADAARLLEKEFPNLTAIADALDDRASVLEDLISIIACQL